VSEIRFNSSRTNVTKHRSILTENEILRLCVQAVALAAGVDTRSASVSVRSFLTTSGGGMSKEAVVELTVDHEPRCDDAKAEVES